MVSQPPQEGHKISNGPRSRTPNEAYTLIPPSMIISNNYVGRLKINMAIIIGLTRQAPDYTKP